MYQVWLETNIIRHVNGNRGSIYYALKVIIIGVSSWDAFSLPLYHRKSMCYDMSPLRSMMEIFIYFDILLW